jgi:hypothetical protein
VNCQDATLVTGKEVIDEIADDRIGLVTKLCHDPADERATARMPFQINRTVKISSAMDFRPAMGATWLLVPDFDEAKFLLKLWIAHDFVS